MWNLRNSRLVCHAIGGSLLFPLFLLLSITTPALCQTVATASTLVPHLVNFSGTVVDAQGQPHSGLIGITFTLYKDEHGGASLWLETQNVQLDDNGHYSVYLGATKPGGVPPELFISGEAHWLDVQVEGHAEQPRVLLVSAPYALKAADAETIGGLPPSAFVLAAPPTNAATTTASTPSTPNATTGKLSVVPPGTINFVPLFTDNSGTLGNSVLFQSGMGATAKMGINTTTPASTLDVKGSSTVRGTLQLPSVGTATATIGSNSNVVDLVASSFNGGTAKAVNQTFQWQAEPTGNNTTAPSGTLNLMFSSGTAKPGETGLKVSSKGLFTFATGQTFPGTGTISGVTAGTGLTGGGSTGSVTLNLDTTKIPQLNVANTFTGNQTVSGNLTATGTVTGNTFQIGNNLFAFGSFASSNAFLGFSGSLFATGTNNTATGAQALSQNAAGSQNTAIGSSSLLSNTSGSSNTAIGNGALNLNSTGSNNTASGAVALQANTTGSYNTANGIFSLFNNTTGLLNTAVGYLSGPDSAHPNLSNSTAIGANATVTASNSMVLGSIAGVNGAGLSTNVGIGTTAPLFALDVHGTGNFTGPITFASSQTFPNTVSGVTAGTGLTGGGTTGNVTLNLDTTKIPQLNVSNTFVGDQTVSGNLSSTGLMTGSGFQIGSNLFAFGSYANSNAFLGFSGNATMTGGSNTANGYGALSSNTTGLGNTASGLVALTFNTTGQYNTGYGLQALFFNTTGVENTATGAGSLPHNTTGGFNTVIGEGTMYDNTSGNNNTAVGGGALFYNVTGSNNSALGYNAGVGSSNSNLTNAGAIGANAEVDESNAIVLGSINGVNNATANTNVGIGTTAPAFTLDVHGTGNFTGPITFAGGQTFPGAGTIFGVTAGTGMTGGGTSGNVTLNVDTTKVVTGVTAGTGLTGGGTGGVQTLNIDTTKVPQLSAANTFTNNQTVSGNLTATGVVTGSSYQIGSTLFAYGSTGVSNAYLGFAGSPNSLGAENTGVGFAALAVGSRGNSNTATGAFALTNNAGSYNVADGYQALDANISGMENTASGSGALFGNQGNYNTAHGFDALYNNTAGFGNTSIGMESLGSNTTGNFNTAVGYLADSGSSNLTNATAIGAFAQVSASNSLVLGSINGVGASNANTNVGIGTTAPIVQLQVQGNDNTGTGVQSLINNTSASGNSFAVVATTSSAGVTNELVADGIGTGPLGIPSGYFGTFTNQPIGFITGNAVRMFIDTTGRVGIGTRSPDNTLSVNGSADKSGGGSWGTFSDGRLKNLNGSFTSGLSEILKLHPIRYRYKEENAMGIHDRDEHVGFVAQDVQKVIPEAVTENSRGYLLVNNDPILWAMLNAIQEQQQQIQEQRQQLRTQQRQIASLNGKLGVLEAALQTTGRGGKSSAVVRSSSPTHQLPSTNVSCTRQRGN
jgi:hypothetical protein